jgi:hypothetical protein
LVPAIEGTIADRLEPSVSRAVVAEQDVIGTVAGIVADRHHCIGRVGAPDLLPAYKRATGDSRQSRFN